MSTSASGDPGARYHHGDLRNALLAAAERIIDQDVTRTFSLRELAREIGVSHAAPYKHFASQADLVADLATRWMTDFVDAQVAAADRTTPRENLLAVGEAYVTWAAAHPSRFTVIFDPALNSGAGAAGIGAQAARHQQLLERLVQAAIGAGDLTGPPSRAAQRLWATVHGLATLQILGHVPAQDVPAVLAGAIGAPSSAADR